MPSRSDARRYATAARLGSLTVANALIFQAELAEVDDRVDPLQRILDHDDPRTYLEEHWQHISDEIDYRSIFGLARDVLIVLPRRVEVSSALRDLVRHIHAIITSRSALRHDLMGRIYHRLLLEAKYLGTYYTSVPSATLLMRLALAPTSWDIDWADIGAIGQLRIADIACGTGTLLMAADQAVVDNYIRQSVSDGNTISRQSLSRLHQELIEQVLHGYDVLSTAIHLTASTLALLAVDTSFRQMNLFSLRFGVEADGTVRLGSIDYLNSTSLSPQLSLVEPSAHPASAVTAEGSSESLAPLPELDLCAINPPFTRSAGKNLLFGSLPAAQRRQLQTQLSSFLREYQRRGAWVSWSITAGLGSIFVSIAAGRIKVGGRLALVLPAAVAFGSSWGRTRLLLTSLFNIEYIIASHDPDRWSFSESTDLSEVLIVARRRADGQQHEDTVFVNLWQNVATSVDGIALGDQILGSAERAVQLVPGEGMPAAATTTIALGSVKRGELFRARLVPGDESQWNGIAFAQTELNRLALQLTTGELRIPGAQQDDAVQLCAFSEICTIGPDGRDVYDCFDISMSETAYRALWGYDAQTMTGLRGVANRYLSPLSTARPGRPLRQLEHVWPRAGRMMIPDKIRLQTRTAVATLLDEPAVSNVWWPVQLKPGLDQRLEKVLTMWFNGSLGITLMLSGRVPTEGPFVKFKKPFLQSLKVLDVRRLTEGQIARFVKEYDAAAAVPFAALSLIDTDAARTHIDRACSAILGLPDLSGIRAVLSREPIISNGRL